jgi:exosortase
MNSESISTSPEIESKGFLDELQACWSKVPNKGLFFGLLAAWVILFQFWGNITLGYVKTHSLFGWLHFVYTTSADDEHGMLIPFVVVFLFWNKRKDLLDAISGIWWPAFALVILAIVLHLVGFRVQQTRISVVAFFFGVWAFLGLIWGKEFLKRSVFPMFIFAFCIPLATEADRITSPLRLIATSATTAVANGLFGFGVIRDGTRVFDPVSHYQYEVAAACSGIRSLTAIFAFTTIYAFLKFKKNWKRAFIVLAAFPLAIVSNVMRLLMIIFAAEISGQKAGNVVHENGLISLLPYIPAIFGVLWMGHLLRDRTQKEVLAPGEPEKQTA